MTFCFTLRPAPLSLRQFTVITALALLVACGGSGPIQPVIPEAPGLTCPANIDLLSPDGNPVNVTYSAPVVTNGSAPVSVACTPPSDTPFAPDQTFVTCTARDTIGRSATCSFLVTVTSAPRLTVSRFLAFGDSITAGVISSNLRLILDPRSYPADLSGLLRARYTRQTIDVFNEGKSGESADLGSRRISWVMDQRQPDVLLLLQGVIDISEKREAGIDQMIQGLKYDIRDAQRRNVKVMLSTLLPQKRGSRAVAIDLIDDANDRIRDLAAREHVTLVDSWQAFKGREATLIGEDGLHPTVEGFQVLAETFYEKIRATLEVPPAATVR